MADNVLSGLSLKGLKGWQKVAIVGGGLGVAGLAFYESKKKSTATAATTAANSTASSAPMVTDPVTGQSYPASADDPETGVTYEQEIGLYGSVEAADAALAGGSNYGLSGVAPTNALVDETPYDATTNTTAEGYSTNAAWSQAVETGLTQIGYSSTDVATALGYYFAGRALTPDQQTIIYDALAEYGPPPSGSYQVIAAPNTVNTGTGSGSTGTSTGTATASTSGGHVLKVNNNEATVAWTGVNAVKYKAAIRGPGKTGAMPATAGSTPEATFTGLRAGHDYVVTVWPFNAAGQQGTAGTINVVTTK